jgi:hypothetical protein
MSSHVVLVHEVLDALEHEGDSYAHFVREMRNVGGIARRDQSACYPISLDLRREGSRH